MIENQLSSNRTRIFSRKNYVSHPCKANPKWEEDRGLYREIGFDWVE